MRRAAKSRSKANDADRETELLTGRVTAANGEAT